MTKRNRMGGTIPPLKNARRLMGKMSKTKAAECEALADAMIEAQQRYIQSPEYAAWAASATRKLATP